MRGPALACLLALLWPAAAQAQLSNLNLHCGSCLGMVIDLDDEHLVFAGGLGAAGAVAGHLELDDQARLTGVAPGPHHLRVTVLQGPLDSQVFYDGPIYLRSGREVHMRVDFGNVVDFREDVLREPLPDGGLPDGGAPDAGPAPPTDGGLARAALVVRADDKAVCSVELDRAPLVELRTRRVQRSGPLEPGRHRVVVRSAKGEVLSSGALFLVAGEETVAGVACSTGQFQTYTDARAYLADPAPPDAGARAR